MCDGYFFFDRFKSNINFINNLNKYNFFNKKGIIFITIGIAIGIANAKLFEKSMQYDLKCDKDKKCVLDFTMDEKIDPPIFIYYQLDNFFQNHRKYITSRSLEQLAGIGISLKKATDLCDPIIRNKDIKIPLKSYAKNIILDPEGIASPCGLVAKSVFNGNKN